MDGQRTEADHLPPSAEEDGSLEEDPVEEDRCAPGGKKTQAKKAAFSNRPIHRSFRTAMTSGAHACTMPCASGAESPARDNENNDNRPSSLNSRANQYHRTLRVPGFGCFPKEERVLNVRSPRGRGHQFGSLVPFSRGHQSEFSKERSHIFF